MAIRARHMPSSTLRRGPSRFIVRSIESMKRSGASANVVFRRSSRTVLASVFDVVVSAALAMACGGAGSGVTATPIPFTDHGSTQQSDYDGAPRVAVATDPAGTGLGPLASRADGRLYIAVYAGSQRTGGY